MSTTLREMVARRDLLVSLVRADLASRYRSTALGVAWFLLTPFIWAVVLVAVFQHVVRLGIPDYPVFVLSALLPWTYFQTGVGAATTSVTRSTNLVKRVRIPRTFLPLASVGATLVHFLAALVVLLGIIVVAGVGLSPAIVLLPAIILVETICIAGAALLGSALNVWFRDVDLFLTAGLRAVFYLTPGFYPLSFVPPEWQPLYLLNPMAGIIHAYREVLLYGTMPPAWILGLSTAMSVILLVVGAAVFHRLEPTFEDRI